MFTQPPIFDRSLAGRIRLHAALAVPLCLVLLCH